MCKVNESKLRWEYPQVSSDNGETIGRERQRFIFSNLDMIKLYLFISLKFVPVIFYPVGLNHFADMSWEEFKATHLLSTPQVGQG